MRTARRLTGVLLLGCAAAIPRAAAQQMEIRGFAQANYAARVSGADDPAGRAPEIPLGDERLQLQLGGFSEDGSAGFSGKVDFFHDAVVDEPGVEVREAYVDLVSRYLALRAGRQIITWGIGDLLFVNDIFPKDWVAFFTGRPLQYLKVGSDALAVDLHPGPANAAIVVAPFFQPDRYPTGERLIVPDPFPPGLPRRVVGRERSLENAEIAAKVSRTVATWDVALYAARTFYRLPAARLDDPVAPTEVRFFFPRLDTYGASANGAIFGGVLGVEGAFYDSRDDRDGTDAAIENGQVRMLVGYSRPLWGDATLGGQGYVEWMRNHDAYVANLPPGFPAHDEARWTATARFTQLLRHQTVTANVFAFWGMTDRDAYLIPSIRYAFTDALWGEVGANVFLGEENHTMFGRFAENDNVYIALQYGF